MKLKETIYLILFILSFILSLIINYDKINVPYFGGLYKSVWVDVIYSEDKDLKLINIKNMNLIVIKIDKNHYLYKIPSFKKVEQINISNPDKIKQIILYIDKKAQFDNFNKINNEKNILDRFSIIILSFFYNFKLYLFSYLFLFLFLHNFKGRIDFKNYFWIILILSFILRIVQLNSIPFWDDEIYILKTTAGYSPLSELFSDPGNPPLYFILFKIYRTIVQNPISFRLLSVIAGCIFCVVFYLYIKKFLNKKTGLIALFFAGFNITLIYFSQEIRCYMFLMLFSLLTSYFLFTKRKYYYLISSIALLYTHFYGAFYFLYNFLFSIFYLKRKRKDALTINLLAGLSFLPCLVFKLKNLPESFNSWIKIPQIEDYIHVIKTFSGYTLIFILLLLILVFVYKNSSKRKKLFISYNFFAIVFVIFAAIIFSYTIKPIFMYRYFYVISPSYIALFLCLTKKVWLNIIIFIVFSTQGFLGYQNLYCNHNLYLDFIKNDIDKTKENYVFMTDTIEGYKEFLFDGIKPIYIQINQGINTINPLKYGVKTPSFCYILNLYLDEKTYSEAKNIEIYKTPLGVFAKVEY